MTADPDRIAEARRLLAALGVSPADLRDRPPVPTLGDYLPRVVAAAGPGALKSYRSYWNHLLVAFGTRPLDRITATDIEQLEYHVATHVVPRRSNRDGRSAREAFIAAARAIYSRAIADDLLPAGSSPAHRVPKPRRLPSTRRALTADELDQINAAARVSGDDPALDALLLRLHTETACRRAGALGLRVGDLETSECLVRLREKGQTVRWQPISPQLTHALAEHATGRGARSAGSDLLRYRDGRPLTARRYDSLWTRIRGQLLWAQAQGISTHWLRHTTLTWVERNFGYGVARAYAGHTDSTGAATTTYIKADIHAVATALAAMTGQPHPLAVPVDELHPVWRRSGTGT
ncbi:tyrosine-type recombinase/integrase [Nocardia terpenica]|uniref:Integrase n=1 Tax=Nocardia terpenica TaxID=455432 RepID=A0A164LSQ7_9NOCA|nr:site-specific integrase [Nocardia terpenica]KZM72710.1 integrase [Nocardia terpenica]NQE92385.1 tyrosine-type recombinase/integrase [Nocardia terpenica]